MKHLLISLLMALVAIGSLSAASLTVDRETILKAQPVTESATLAVVKAGVKADILDEAGEYSLITTQDAVPLSGQKSFKTEGWVWDSLFTWNGTTGVAKEDAAICAGPYLAGHDQFIGAVKKGGTVTRTKHDSWWYKITVNNVTGWIFRTVVTVAP